MGCHVSKGDTAQAADGSKLSAQEVQARIEAPVSSVTLEIGGYKIRYAYISQRGFYPDDRDKANQDSYVAIPSFDGDKNKALFMVFDGHGKTGDLCAHFCRDHLPGAVAKALRSSSTVEAGLVSSFVDTNQKLHQDPTVDDKLSGSTAVGIFIHGRDMYIANVGDSRAILCQDQEGSLVAKPLSCDQTPYRRDERERVKACGARVMSMDQIEGIEPLHENWGDIVLGTELDEEGDPPRIWSPYGEYPGTAFSRSIGDSLAEELGVFAEPEIIHRRVQPTDRYIIIASDGVFEFLINQSVAEMVARHPDPLEACKKVVQESYDLWLLYEVRTDDITIICLYIEGVEPEASNPLELDGVPLEGFRPVRREMSRQRQRQLIPSGQESITSSPFPSPHRDGGSRPDEEPIDHHNNDIVHHKEEHHSQKTPEQAAVILNAIKSNFLFDHISEQQRQVLLDVMRREEVKVGDWVIKQGEQGDQFYIIESGSFEVRVNNDKEVVTDPADAGQLVHVYEPTDTLKPCFGHLALLYGKPRSASVFARTDGVLWILGRSMFRKIVVKKSMKEVARTLRSVEVLKSLTLQQLQQLYDCFQEAEYEPEQHIIRQGEVGDTFYIIEDGVARITQVDELGVESVLRRLGAFTYFGERALLTSEPRSANVIAEGGRVKCLQISKKKFEQVLGPLQHLIDDDRKRREQRFGVPFSSLRLRGVVCEDELGQTNLCVIGGSKSGGGGGFSASSDGYCSIRTMWKSEIAKAKQTTAVFRAVEVLRHVSDSLTTYYNTAIGGASVIPVAALMGTYNQPTSLHTVMKCAVVCNLSQLVAEKGSLTFDSIRHIAACVVSGLEFLHSAKVLCRGLSPELVSLDSKGNAVLCEFRLARLGLDGSTLCGTPEFLAPEQVRHLGHGKEVDYWALGVLLYELVHGTSPFAAGSEMEVYSKIAAHTPGAKPFPSSFSPALCDLLDRLLQPDPKLRLGSGEKDTSLLKYHQWFAGFDWAGLSKGKCSSAELKSVAQARLETALRTEGELNSSSYPYSGDQSSWERF